jgi:dihydrodipicolinate reductase
MKKIVLLIVWILILSCSKVSQTKYSTDSEKVFLIITENTTESELTKIASEFKKEKDIIIDFSKTEFWIDNNNRNEYII